MLNRITIMGRLTRDPEMRRTGSGVAVTSFRVAVDRDYVAEGQERETDFFDVVAWRGLGEMVAKYFTKGRMIVVDGRMEMRNWTDKEGNKRVSAEVNAENVYFADSKKEDKNQNAGSNANNQPNGYVAPPAAPAMNAGGYNAPAPKVPQGGYAAPAGPAAPQSSFPMPDASEEYF